MNDESPNHDHDINVHVGHSIGHDDSYCVDSDGFDFVERQDVVVTHNAVYGSVDPKSLLHLEALPPLFYIFCGFSLFLLGSSFANVDLFSARLDKGPGSGGGPTYAPIFHQDPPLVQGTKFFKGNCVACHQASGLGQPGNIPPLAGSEWVLGSKARLVAILSHGLEGPIQVKGAVYNGQMPAYTTLDTEKLADLLTYIRSQWDNAADQVTPDDATKARATNPGPGPDGVYTEPELVRIK